MTLRKKNLPRKLDRVHAEHRPLAQQSFDFSSDTYEYLRQQQEDIIELDTSVTQLKADVEALQAGGGGGVTDHGALTGLGDDDHTQYLRADGTRALTANWSAGSHKITNLAAPTNPSDAARLADITGVSFGSPVAASVGDSNTDGTSGNAARADHKHAIARGTPTSLSVGGSNSGGSSGNFAAADHTHAITRGTPSTLVVGGSNSAGSSSNFAGADHVHGLPAFGSSSGTFCEGNDARLIATADYRKVFIPDAESTGYSGDEMHTDGTGGYSVWENRGYITWGHSTDYSAYHAAATGDGSTDWGMLYTGKPSSEFCVATHVSLQVAPANTGIDIGIWVGDVTSATAAAGRCIVLSSTTTLTSSPASQTGTTTNSTTGLTTGTTGPSFCPYLRLRVNGTTVISDISPDGRTWTQLTSVTAATINHVGLIFRCLPNAQVGVGHWYWVRYATGAGSSSATSLPLLGRLMRLPIA